MSVKVAPDGGQCFGYTVEWSRCGRTKGGLIVLERVMPHNIAVSGAPLGASDFTA